MSNQPSTRRRRASTTARRMPNTSPRSASIALLVLGVWTALGPWFVGYPFTASANAAILRHFALAIVVAYAGFYTYYVGTSGIPSFLGAIGGILLIVAAIAFQQGAPRITANEVGTGALVVIAAVMSVPRGAADRR